MKTEAIRTPPSTGASLERAWHPLESRQTRPSEQRMAFQEGVRSDSGIAKESEGLSGNARCSARSPGECPIGVGTAARHKLSRRGCRESAEIPRRPQIRHGNVLIHAK